MIIIIAIIINRWPRRPGRPRITYIIISSSSSSSSIRIIIIIIIIVCLNYDDYHDY